MNRHTPMVGITTDVVVHANGERVFAYRPYIESVVRAGGVPVLLPPVREAVEVFVDRLDAFVLTGGDDPHTEPFGEPTHPKVTQVHDDRQVFETALLVALASLRPDVPVLGVCLGMQMMALVAGGRLEQYMPETCPTHEAHWDHEHAVAPVEEMGDALIDGSKSVVLRGTVLSKHKQAVADAGRMKVIARAPDGIVESIVDASRQFYVGVQWHPERTAEPAVGQEVFDALVRACSSCQPRA